MCRLEGLIWMVPWEGGDSGAPMGVSTSHDSVRQGRLDLHSTCCRSRRLCLQLPWGQLHSPSCLKARQMAFPWNYLRAAFMPNWPVKENPRETVWIFHFRSGQHSLTHSLQDLIIELVLYGCFPKVTSCILFPSPLPPFLSSFLPPSSFLPSLYPSIHPSIHPSFHLSHPNFQNAMMCQTHNVKYSGNQKS